MNIYPRLRRLGSKLGREYFADLEMVGVEDVVYYGRVVDGRIVEVLV